MIERKFSDLSRLTYHIFTEERTIRRKVEIMILEWTGVYGVGSLGNDDGVFMRVTTLAAISAWRPKGLVFDLRNLHYEWGDKIWEMYGRGIDPSGVEVRPYATVISDRCRPGFQTCMSIIEPAFEALDAAIDDVAHRADDELEKLFAELDGE